MWQLRRKIKKYKKVDKRKNRDKNFSLNSREQKNKMC